jgi:hypothetical protein
MHCSAICCLYHVLYMVDHMLIHHVALLNVTGTVPVSKSTL